MANSPTLLQEMTGFDPQLSVVYAETIARVTTDVDDPEADAFRFYLGCTCITNIANKHMLKDAEGNDTPYHAYVCLETMTDEAASRLKDRLLTYEQLESIAKGIPWKPDFVKVGLFADGMPYGKGEVPPTVKPVLYEFTICYSGNLEIAYRRKMEKLQGRGVVLVFGFEGEIHPEVYKHLDSEQIQAVLGTIVKHKVTLSEGALLTLKMGTSDRWWLADNQCWLEKGVHFATSSKESNRLVRELVGRAAEFGAERTMRVIKEGQSLRHSDGTPLEVGKESYWRGIYPVNLTGKLIGADMNQVQACEDILKDIGAPMENMCPCPGDVYSVIKDTLRAITDGKCTSGGELPLAYYSPASRQEVRVGFKKRAQGGTTWTRHNASNASRALRRVEPWMEELEEALTIGKATFHHERMKERYTNDSIVDQKLHDYSDLIDRLIGHPPMEDYVEVVRQAVSKVDSVLFNCGKTFSIHELRVGNLDRERMLHGMVIRGPCHPSEDTTPVPMIFIQRVTRPWGSPAFNRKANFYHSKSKAGYVYYVRTSAMRLDTLRFLRNANNIWVAAHQKVNELTELGIQDEEYKKSMALSATFFSLMFGTSACTEAEAVCADMKRLMHIQDAVMDGKRLIGTKGFNPWEKVSKSLHQNWVSLYLADSYNKYLLPQLNEKLADAREELGVYEELKDFLV